MKPVIGKPPRDSSDEELSVWCRGFIRQALGSDGTNSDSDIRAPQDSPLVQSNDEGQSARKPSSLETKSEATGKASRMFDSSPGTITGLCLDYSNGRLSWPELLQALTVFPYAVPTPNGPRSAGSRGRLRGLGLLRPGFVGRGAGSTGDRPPHFGGTGRDRLRRPRPPQRHTVGRQTTTDSRNIHISTWNPRRIGGKDAASSINPQACCFADRPRWPVSGDGIAQPHLTTCRW